MTIAQQIGDLHLAKDYDDRRRDFIKLVKYRALGRTGPAEAAHLAICDRAPQRVVDAIKAATDPMSLASVGGQLSPFELLAQAFMNSLASVGAFDTMLGSMMKLPLRSKIVSVTTTITGISLAEADIKRVGSLSLSASDLTISKVVATLAITKETLLAGGDGALQFIERELRQSVAVATDVQFLNLITTGATSMPSSGSNAIAMRLDLRALIQTLAFGAGSRLFLITTPDIAAAWATVGDSNGGPAFPNATWNGGSAGGIPIIATDGCPNATIILADASGIAGNSEELRVDTADQTSLQMDSTPDSPPTASTNMLSLWQLNMTGIKCERYFGAKTVRANSVAMITGANYSGSSP